MDKLTPRFPQRQGGPAFLALAILLLGCLSALAPLACAGHREAAGRSPASMPLPSRSAASVDSLLQEGGRLFAAERYAAAIGPLSRAVALDPRNATAQGLLGGALQLAGRPREAIPHLEEALRMDPAQPLIHLGLVASHYALGEMEAARRSALQGLALLPGRDRPGWRALLQRRFPGLGPLPEP